ncbi:MAG: DNA helicase RecQ [Phycisphaerales bacterium]
MSSSTATGEVEPRLMERARETVKEVWGFEALRPLQRDAIEAGLAGRDSLVVLPTGGGKSLCYQAPAVVAGRTDLVVSPLISLMKDQVDALRANGVAAAALHTGVGADERRQIAKELKAGLLRLLFVAPERLFQPAFLDFLEQSAPVRAVAIDEAHCISHWGHDFRPEYRRLAELRDRFRDASFHAFTATATERVRHDIVEQLGLRDPRVLVGSFDRPNLTYRVRPRVDAPAQTLEIIRRHENEAVIVYCLSRKETESLAEFLRANGVDAAPYHAGLSAERRRDTQDDFARERLNVVTATVAFGMGIDRSDVRCVIHTTMPKSIEHFQQETGRAGRDGLPAECVLLYSAGDLIRWRRLIEQSAGEGGSERGDDDANAEALQAAGELLEEMRRFAGGVICRHRALVEYFGQEYGDESCGACDVCLDEIEALPDSQVIAQKIISCVARVRERFGVGHIVDVLAGADTDAIRRNRHDQLSVHGLLRELPKKQITNLTHQLLDQGVLTRSDGRLPVVTLNDRAMAVIRGDEEVVLLKPAGGAKASRFDAESWEGVDRPLFEKLRALRKEIAETNDVPPYVIFSDASLRDFARRRPTSVDRLRAVYGVGEHKAREYGPQFIDAVKTHADETGVDTDIDAPPGGSGGGSAGIVRPPSMTEAKRKAFDLFRAETPVAEVAKTVGRAKSTTWGYLFEFIAAERPERLDAWVEPALRARIDAAMDEVGTRFLRPVFERLNEEAPYEVIRAVATSRRAREMADGE